MTQVRRLAGPNIINKNFTYDFIPVGLVLGLSLVITFYHELDFHILYNDVNIPPEKNPMLANRIITDRSWMRESARLGDAKFNYSDMTLEHLIRNPPQPKDNSTLFELLEKENEAYKAVIEYDKKWANRYEKKTERYGHSWYPDNHAYAIERGKLLKYYHELRYLVGLEDKRISDLNGPSDPLWNNFNIYEIDIEPVYTNDHNWKIHPLAYYTGMSSSSWENSPRMHNFYGAELQRLRNYGYRGALDDNEFITVIKETERFKQITQNR